MFCRERGTDPILTSLDQLIEFLTEIFESGVGYSSVDPARSVYHLFPLWAMGYLLANIPLFSVL